MQIERDLYPWISVGALVWGLLDCFFGYRIFKVTIAILGAVIGAFLGHLVAQAAGLGSGGELGGMFVGALLGAGLAFLLYIAAVFLAGFGFGATLGLLLLAHFNHGVALVASLLIGLIGGYAAVKLQKVLIVLATALLGSFRAILALAFFTSQIDWLFYFQQPQHLPALIDNNAWMFPSILVLAAVGAIAQFEIGGKGGGGKSGSAKKKNGDAKAAE